MDVQPATISQIRMAETGQVVELSADAGTVAGDLARIDPGLKVRINLAAAEPAWIVYHDGHPDCPHNGAGGEHETYLVTTCRAHRNRLGTWEGLDQRIVTRIMQIGHSSYDYATELERANVRAREAKLQADRERMGPLHERAAHALRKDLGARYKGRTFVPSDLPA